MRIFWLVILWAIGFPMVLHAAVYSTWDAPELDKYACIWYIQKYIDPKAEFRFFPLGEDIKEGIPFDVPFAKWRREGAQSALDVIVEETGRTGPAIEHLRLLIREVEISPWARPPSEEATRLEESLRDLLEASRTANDKIANGIEFFNGYLQHK